MTEARILVVDDDRDFAEALIDKRFDVILMDIALPGIDGIEALQRIQARDPNVKALLMTGYIAHHLRVRTAGTEILTKPLNHEDLLQRIRQSLGQDR